jgi:tRNA pseudouridine38-40 synthase
VLNIKLVFQYDGTGFSGYELQPGKRTVRGEIEKALLKLYRKKISLISSSRTDAGVHALQNIINFKTSQKIPIDRIPFALNSILPDDIRVSKAEKKGSSFNSRFDARSKEYEYLIYNGEILPPAVRTLVWQVKPKLNTAAMKKAAKHLIGKHDFSSFCASHSDDKDFVRTIHSFGIRNSEFGIWNGQKIKVIRIKVKGNGFLYKMVRNMVGTLVDVGLGRFRPEEVKAILNAKDRRLAGRTAPAQGLCLIKVNY